MQRHLSLSIGTLFNSHNLYPTCFGGGSISTQETIFGMVFPLIIQATSLRDVAVLISRTTMIFGPYDKIFTTSSHPLFFSNFQQIKAYLLLLVGQKVAESMDETTKRYVYIKAFFLILYLMTMS